MFNKIKNLEIEYWALLPFLFLGIVMTTLYIFNYSTFFHSDVAVANLLAREQWYGKSFFPINWIYAQDIWISFIN